MGDNRACVTSQPNGLEPGGRCRPPGSDNLDRSVALKGDTGLDPVEKYLGDLLAGPTKTSSSDGRPGADLTAAWLDVSDHTRRGKREAISSNHCGVRARDKHNVAGLVGGNIRRRRNYNDLGVSL